MALLGGLRALLGNGPRFVVFAVVSLAAVSGLWWFTAWFMLMGQVRWRVLIPTGVITGVVLEGYTLSATLWMPQTVTRNETQFGFFGVALALVTWFSGAAICILVGRAQDRCSPPTPARSGRSSEAASRRCSSRGLRRQVSLPNEDLGSATRSDRPKTKKTARSVVAKAHSPADLLPGHSCPAALRGWRTRARRCPVRERAPPAAPAGSSFSKDGHPVLVTTARPTVDFWSHPCQPDRRTGVQR